MASKISPNADYGGVPTAGAVMMVPMGHTPMQQQQAPLMYGNHPAFQTTQYGQVALM